MAVYEFHCYRFEPSVGLFRDGQEVPIPPKEEQLLALLLGRAGHTVTIDEIEGCLWPRQCVSYDSIARCVSSLRKILGGQRHAYIRTLPKRGYQLTVPVVSGRPLVRHRAIDRIVETNPQAYSNFIDGIREANWAVPARLARAIARFESAIAADPNYAAAYAAIADCRMYQIIIGYIAPAEGAARCRAAAEQALSLDPTLVAARSVHGWLTGLVDRRIDTGLAAVDEALRIDPTYSRGYAYRAWLLRSAGRLSDGVSAAREAARLDPHALLNRHMLAWTLFMNRLPKDALEVERRAQAEYPDDVLSAAYIAIFAAWLGNFDLAFAEAQRALKLSKHNPAIASARGYVLARAGRNAQARELGEWIRAQALPRAPLPMLAMIYAALGDEPTVVTLLRQARDEGCPWFAGGLYDPRLGALSQSAQVLDLYRA